MAIEHLQLDRTVRTVAHTLDRNYFEYGAHYK